MEKNQANVEQIVYNVLSVEIQDSEILTSEKVAQIAELYLLRNSVSLPYSIVRTLEKSADDDEVPSTVRALKAALHQEFQQYSPKEKKAFEDAAEAIIVKVSGVEFETYLDQFGTQRFKTDTVIVHLFDQNLIDLDELSRSFYRGEITTEDLLNFYAKSGYSVGGLSGLSHFSHLTFENPLWDSEA
jgi:hypothetical protein